MSESDLSRALVPYSPSRAHAVVPSSNPEVYHTPRRFNRNQTLFLPRIFHSSSGLSVVVNCVTQGPFSIILTSGKVIMERNFNNRYNNNQGFNSLQGAPGGYGSQQGQGQQYPQQGQGQQYPQQGQGQQYPQQVQGQQYLQYDQGQQYPQQSQTQQLPQQGQQVDPRGQPQSGPQGASSACHTYFGNSFQMFFHNPGGYNVNFNAPGIMGTQNGGYFEQPQQPIYPNNPGVDSRNGYGNHPSGLESGTNYGQNQSHQQQPNNQYCSGSGGFPHFSEDRSRNGPISMPTQIQPLQNGFHGYNNDRQIQPALRRSQSQSTLMLDDISDDEFMFYSQKSRYN